MLNKTIGSLAGQGVNYALGNDFTLNVLNFGMFNKNIYNTGLLELHLGRDGTTMNFGTGGADISYHTLQSAIDGIKVLNVNSKINKYVKDENNDFNSAIALRSQYGYGDENGKNQLWEILKGNTILTTSDGDVFSAQTTIVDGQKVITIGGFQAGMDMNEMSFADQMRLGVTLEHESYRDGIVTDDNYLETRTATIAHTEMAIRMIADGQQITLDENIVKDIYAYSKGIDSFNNYVDTNYDSSNDYWKLMSNGTLVNDGSGWLKDENGKYILIDGQRVGANGIETGLLNILFGGTNGISYDNYTNDQIYLAQMLMINSGMNYTEGSIGDIRSRSWTGNSVGQSLNMNTVMLGAGGTVAAPVFARYYENNAISLIAQSTDMYIGNIGDINYLPANTDASARFYNSFLPSVEDYFNSMRHFVDNSFWISGKHGATGVSYSNYNAHFGTDFVNGKRGDPIYMGISGTVTYIDNDNSTHNNGNWMVVEYGYNFEGSFIGSGIYGEYMHMEVKPNFALNTYLISNQIIGTVGNTGRFVSTLDASNPDRGVHLHHTLFTLENNNFSQATLLTLLNNNIGNTVTSYRTSTYNTNSSIPGRKTTYNIQNYLITH